MLTEILSFLTSQKTIIVGAAACVCEVIVLVVNTYRKLHSQNIQFKTLGTYKQVTSTKEIFFWALNPINLFRKIN